MLSIQAAALASTDFLLEKRIPDATRMEGGWSAGAHVRTPRGPSRTTPRLTAQKLPTHWSISCNLIPKLIKV